MKIEIGGDIKNLDVVEYTIRNTKGEVHPDIESEVLPHFQARIRIDEIAKESEFDCEISYYNERNEFLGLTESFTSKTRSITNEPRALSVPLDIPDGTAKVLARFIEQDHVFSQSLWLKILKYCGTFFVLILLCSWAVKSVMSIVS